MQTPKEMALPQTTNFKSITGNLSEKQYFDFFINHTKKPIA
jgi:hypothetical protein